MKKYFLYFNGPLVVGYLLYLHFWVNEELSFWGTVVAGFKASIFILFLPIVLLFTAYVLAVEYILIAGVVIFILSILYLSYSYYSSSEVGESKGVKAVMEIVIAAFVITVICLALLKGSYLIIEFLGSFPTKEDLLYDSMR